jgi:putative glycosyltransferase (TIGR04372 family)
MQAFKKKINLFLTVFFGLPLAVIIKLLNPFLVIRVGRFHASRIGHFALDFGLYLSRKSLAKKKTLDIFTISQPICNYYFFQYVKRNVLVIRGLSFLIAAIELLPNPSFNLITPDLEVSQSFDRDRLLSQSKNSLKFSDEENALGKAFLASIGCDDLSKLVCMNIRDDAYLNQVYASGIGWGGHSYRDSNILDYKLGVLSLLDRGYFVIRMGSVVNKKLDISHPNFFDYPFSGLGSDFFDIWLMANCKFCISSSNGLECVSDIFNIPMLFVNAAPIGHINSWSKGSIWTPKIIVNTKTKKPISLQDQINNKLICLAECDKLNMTYSEYLESLGMEILNNSEELIDNSFMEFIDKLENKWDESDAYNKRQSVFWRTLIQWEHFPNYHNKCVDNVYGSLSDSFIKEHGNWYLDHG